MAEWGDARFTGLAAWPVVRQRQANVRAVLAFLREVAASTRAEMNESAMVALGKHAEALRVCCRCVRDLSADNGWDEEAEPSLFMTKLDELVATLQLVSDHVVRPTRDALREKDVMVQLLGCVYDVPHFGSRQYEGLLDPGGLREVFAQNATFIATVKLCLNNVRSWLEREAPVDMEGMVWYYTELQEKLEKTAEEALQTLCEPGFDLHGLSEDLQRKIAGLVARVAESPGTTTVITRRAAVRPAVREDFLGTDNFFVLFKRLRELQSFIAFCDVLASELLPENVRYDRERERTRMKLKDEFTTAVGCIPQALTAFRKMQNRPDISDAQGEGTWLAKLQALERDVVYWNGGDQHNPIMFRLIVLLFDVPETFYFGRAPSGSGEDELHHSYTRVWDPGDMRHVFQNHKTFMTMVKDTARLNWMSPAFLQPRVQEYKELETKLMAKQKALIAELPTKYDEWRSDARVAGPQEQTADLSALLRRMRQMA